MNPLSEDQRFMRFSLLPALLALGTDKIFEIGDVFADAGEIVERTHATFVRRAPAHRKVIHGATNTLSRSKPTRSHSCALQPAATRAYATAKHAGWHPGICAELVLDDVPVAIVGALDPRLTFALGIEGRAHAAQVDLALLPDPQLPRYLAPSRYPASRAISRSS